VATRSPRQLDFLLACHQEVFSIRCLCSILHSWTKTICSRKRARGRAALRSTICLAPRSPAAQRHEDKHQAGTASGKGHGQLPEVSRIQLLRSLDEIIVLLDHVAANQKGIRVVRQLKVPSPLSVALATRCRTGAPKAPRCPSTEMLRVATSRALAGLLGVRELTLFASSCRILPDAAKPLSLSTALATGAPVLPITKNAIFGCRATAFMSGTLGDLLEVALAR